jgi:plasmid stabilization system protein ParE
VIDQPDEPPAPSRRLVIVPRAEAEMQAAFEWYESQSVGLGAELVRALDAVLQRIQREPTLYAVVRPGVRRALLRRFPYGVFYAEYPDRVTVLAFVHARQDPRRWPARPAR